MFVTRALGEHPEAYLDTLTIRGNHLTDNGMHGLHLADELDYIHIHANQFNGNGRASGEACAAIYIDRTDPGEGVNDVEIMSNIFGSMKSRNPPSHHAVYKTYGYRRGLFQNDVVLADGGSLLRWPNMAGVISGNEFRVGTLPEVLGNDALVVGDNRGWNTATRGRARVANGDTNFHGLAGTPAIAHLTHVEQFGA